MLGLAVLFFLALWIVGTLFAMWLGAKIGKGFGDLVHMPFAGAFVGLLCGFMMPTGFMFLGWAKEKIDAETTVADLCATKAGIHIYLSPEEHARRIRDNDWEGVTRAEVRDEVNGPYVIGKIISIDGRKFTASNEAMAGKHGKIIVASEWHRKEYPRHIAYVSYLHYDVEHQVPLFRSESFDAVFDNAMGLKFWANNIYRCSNEIDNIRFHLSKGYIH